MDHDDLARLHTGHGPENRAIFKHMAMTLVRQATPPASLKTAASSPDGTQATSKHSSARQPKSFKRFPWFPCQEPRYTTFFGKSLILLRHEREWCGGLRK